MLREAGSLCGWSLYPSVALESLYIRLIHCGEADLFLGDRDVALAFRLQHCNLHAAFEWDGALIVSNRMAIE